jgi:hypothetical protein
MTSKVYSVSIDGRNYSAAFQTESQYSAAWEKVLAHAHENKLSVRCCCMGRGQKLLAPKKYAARFGLARYGQSGPEHAADCVYHSWSHDRSGMQAYGKDAIEDMESGGVRLNRPVGLPLTDAPLQSGREPALRPVPTEVRDAGLSLYGVLQLVWHVAQMNVWHPKMEGTRKPRLVSHFLDKAASKIRLDRSGRECLGQHTVLAWSRNNLRKIEAAVEGRSRILLISPLARWKEGMDLSEALPLADRQVFSKIWMSRQGQSWERTQEDFPYALEAWRRGDCVMAAVLAHPYPFKRNDEKGNDSWSCQAFSLALMPVTDDWIPYANDAERMLLAKLKEEGRSFTRPLAFDADPCVLFPTMILHDCEETALMPMEIVKTAGPIPHGYADFRQRYFSNGFGVENWWTWNIRSSDQDMPDLPPRRRKKSMQVEPVLDEQVTAVPSMTQTPNATMPAAADPYSGVFI